MGIYKNGGYMDPNWRIYGPKLEGRGVRTAATGCNWAVVGLQLGRCMAATGDKMWCILMQFQPL